MIPHTLYHITTVDVLPSILKNGLKPMIGPNSDFNHEPESCIYCCDQKSIPYWLVLLTKTHGRDLSNIKLVTIKEANNLDEIPSVNYYGKIYAEYMYHKPIPTFMIKETCIPDNIIAAIPRANTQLVYNHTDTISWICSDLARKFTRHIDKNIDYSIQTHIDQLIETMDNVIHAGQRLDFKRVHYQYIRKHLIHEGNNGEYTFNDLYFNTNNRLWEMLSVYPTWFQQNNITPEIQQLFNMMKKTYQHIIQNYSYTLRHLDTGGFSI